MNKDTYMRALAQLQGFFQTLNDAGIEIDRTLEIDLRGMRDRGAEFMACDVLDDLIMLLDQQ